MKNILSTLIAICCFTMCAAQVSDEVIIPLSNPGQASRLKVDIKKGFIEVVGTDRSDVLLKYTIEEKKDEESDPPEEGLQKVSTSNIDIEISEHDNEVEIESDSWFRDFNVKLEVPKKMALDLASYMGAYILVENINGALDLESYNGKITATGISGTVNASTYNGEIKIELDKITPDESMAFSNYNGTIELVFPEDYAANLKMKTVWGDIYSNHNLEVENKKPALIKVETSDFKLKSDEWTRGKLNAGGPEILIKNFTGGIRIKKK